MVTLFGAWCSCSMLRCLLFGNHETYKAHLQRWHLRDTGLGNLVWEFESVWAVLVVRFWDIWEELWFVWECDLVWEPSKACRACRTLWECCSLMWLSWCAHHLKPKPQTSSQKYRSWWRHGGLRQWWGWWKQCMCALVWHAGQMFVSGTLCESTDDLKTHVFMKWCVNLLRSNNNTWQPTRGFNNVKPMLNLAWI